jgi:serine/threonine-protein kinase
VPLDFREKLQDALGTAYTLEGELGGGGMSRVFAARETALGRPVAVKVLSPELGAGVNLDRFRREIQLSANLQHPHVVPLLTAGESGGLIYYTMPLIRGETLRARIDRMGRFEISDAVRFLRDMVEALAHAHGHRVVHRDIKPENVLISERHALIMDFGVAKALTVATDDTLRSSLGLALGTPMYMAPEQVAADPSTDHRADLYSVGVVAYEMLAGKPPFHGRTPHRVMAAHAMEAPEPIQHIRPEIPSGLAALIMRCLEKDPAERPPSADELLRVLERHSTSTPRKGIPVLAGHVAARRWIWISLSVAAAGILALYLSGAIP